MGAAIALNYARQGDLVRPRVRATNLAIINGSQPQLPSFSSKVCKRVGGGAPFRVKPKFKIPTFRGHTGVGRRTKKFDN